MSTSAHPEPVTITTCRDLNEAHVVLSALAASGIEAFIPDEQMAGLYPTTILDTNGVRVQVAADDAERAQAVLDAGAAG
jgi:hypothetical protein